MGGVSNCSFSGSHGGRRHLGRFWLDSEERGHQREGRHGWILHAHHSGVGHWEGILEGSGLPGLSVQSHRLLSLKKTKAIEWLSGASAGTSADAPFFPPQKELLYSRSSPCWKLTSIKLLSLYFNVLEIVWSFFLMKTVFWHTSFRFVVFGIVMTVWNLRHNWCLAKKTIGSRNCFTYKCCVIIFVVSILD